MESSSELYNFDAPEGVLGLKGEWGPCEGGRQGGSSAGYEWD